MKVLVILQKDVYNIPTYHVVKEMMNRNYELDFYAVYMDYNHLRMFEDLKIEIRDIAEMQADSLEKYDFIYSAIGIRGIPQIFEIKKYIFSFSTAFMDDIINYGDYTFTQRDFGIRLQDYEYAIDINNELKSKPGMVVGNPKFDEDCRTKDETNDKQILFIDAGHFPFGKTGKMEEAKMLVEIAKKFPQYQIIIKPRFLPEDKNVTHRNGVHLYDCIQEVTGNDVPQNLNCLRRHVDLEKLVRESNLIITPDLTTSYLDIARYDKAGLIATGIPSEFTVTHGKDHIRRFKNIEQRSGLCVPYKEICEYIPQGKKCNQQHVDEMGLNQKNASIKMVDNMERVYADYISKGRYPSRDGKASITFETVMSLRYIRDLFDMVEPYISKMEFLEFTDVMNQLRMYLKTEKNISEEEYAQLQREVMAEIGQIILDKKDDMLKDEIGRDYYLQELYTNNLLEMCDKEIYKENPLYYYFWAKYLINVKKEYKIAVEHLQKYFDLTKNNTYEKKLGDIEYFKESATYWLAYGYYQMNEYEKAKKYFQKCQELTSNKHKKAKEYLEKIG